MLSRYLHIVNMIARFAGGQSGGLLPERMFDIAAGWVSNTCSRGVASIVRQEGGGVELIIKVVLVGYVAYAVLGAPLLAPRRQRV